MQALLAECLHSMAYGWMLMAYCIAYGWLMGVGVGAGVLLEMDGHWPRHALIGT